jgi:hypothetical protein
MDRQPAAKPKSLRFGLLLGLFVLLYIAAVMAFIIVY